VRIPKDEAKKHFLRCPPLIKWLSQTALPPPKPSCPPPRGAAGLRKF
jgi:hypothetical protein